MREKPKILNSTIVASSRLFRIEEVDLEFSNGEKRVFERLRGTRSGGTVMMVALEQDNDTIFLVREYAAGTDKYELALPKGLLEPEENVLAAANREMQEELQMAARTLVLMKEMTNAPGYMGGRTQTVLARDLYPSALPGDEPEPIEVIPWKLSRLDELLSREDFSEARSIAALFMVKDFIRKST